MNQLYNLQYRVETLWVMGNERQLEIPDSSLAGTTWPSHPMYGPHENRVHSDIYIFCAPNQMFFNELGVRLPLNKFSINLWPISF